MHQALGDQAQDVVSIAIDTVQESLRNESMKDFVLGPISNGSFSQQVNLSKKITDYGAEDEAEVDPDIERKYADEVGVAVVFGEEE